ncbi:MAG: hypothetical protein IKB96_05615 [Prevotella sp.]|nr:hypothetical protein [Prevotella sp.]
MSEYVYATDEHKGHWLTGEEIVRCKDCESYQPGMYEHFTCEYLHQWAKPDDFCCWGERKQ